MPKQPAKPSASRTNDPTIARYTGMRHNEAACSIGKCDYSITGANYDDARDRIRQHREISHA